MATGELVEEVVDEVADHMEEVAEITRRITGRDISVGFFGGCVGAAGGIAIGYFVARNKLEAKYAQLAEEEISEYREHFYRKVQAQEATAEKAATPEEVVKNAGYTPYSDIEQSPNQDTPVKEAPVLVPDKTIVLDEVPTNTNVFDIPQPTTPEWDQATEEASRSLDIPYVIHKDEYDANVHGYDQTTFAYYEDDDVLANDEDKPVHSQDGLVPADFTEKFGHGSGDPNVVYIRNDELSVDIEIIRNQGNFAEVVHGFLRHSDERGKRRKPRFDDDR